MMRILTLNCPLNYGCSVCKARDILIMVSGHVFDFPKSSSCPIIPSVFLCVLVPNKCQSLSVCMTSRRPLNVLN